MDLPEYVCHKRVRAAKIVRVDDFGHSGQLVFGSRPRDTVAVSEEWMRKHQPTAGGYFVVYEDGYQSFSPGKAFEDGYSRVEG